MMIALAHSFYNPLVEKILTNLKISIFMIGYEVSE